MIDLQDSTEPEICVAARVLSRIDAAAQRAGVDYLVVGATARTMLSIGLVGRSPERATGDIDIAVAVGSWADFERLTKELEKHGPGPHKFLVENVEVDVVPYGGIESADRTILWPDDHQMNVRGLSEAAPSAETVVLPGGLTTRVPTIPALALLKLLTWWDRRNSTTRDAIDLATMIDWYSTGPYFDRLYEEEMDILVRYDFDPLPAGAWLLGSHMPDLLDPAGVAALLNIVEREDSLAQLANDTRRRSPQAQELVQALGQGIREAAQRTEDPA